MTHLCENLKSFVWFRRREKNKKRAVEKTNKLLGLDFHYRQLPRRKFGQIHVFVSQALYCIQRQINSLSFKDKSIVDHPINEKKLWGRPINLFSFRTSFILGTGAVKRIENCMKIFFMDFVYCFPLQWMHDAIK